MRNQYTYCGNCSEWCKGHCKLHNKATEEKGWCSDFLSIKMAAKRAKVEKTSEVTTETTVEAPKKIIPKPQFMMPPINLFQKPAPRKLSVEEMNKIILEKIPLSERLRAVYVPIIVMDCVCYLGEELLQIFRIARFEGTKKFSRELKDSMLNYQRDNQRVMHSDLYNDLRETTREFFDMLRNDMFIYKIQYMNELLKMKIKFSEQEKEFIVAYLLVVRKLSEFVIALDRQFSKRISDMLGKDINYTTEDYGHTKRIIQTCTDALKFFGVEGRFENDQTELCFKIFKMKLNSVKI